MKKYRFEIIIAVFLILTALFLYYLHVAIFHDLHHLIIYGLEDLAFLPLEVLLVTLVLDRLLELRSKNDRNSKINMIIGTYFAEIGNSLFKTLAESDTNKEEFKSQFIITGKWNNSDFKKAAALARKHKSILNISDKQFCFMRNLLVQKRELLVNLTQNPVLLEHSLFSDLLLATFHLADELTMRERFDTLPDKDIDHISFDAKRVYSEIIIEWIKYMKHLKSNYPYLFSLSCRVNPLNEKASIVIEK